MEDWTEAVIIQRDIIIRLMTDINLETRLSELNIGPNDLDTIINNGFNSQRMKNNPRMVTESKLRFILESML